MDFFCKYYNIAFVDKNPEGDADADGLIDERDWEHRVIKDIVWERKQGYVVETALLGGVAHQSIERYEINPKLHDMIRASPHNERPMFSELSNTSDVDDRDNDSGGSGDCGNSGDLGGDSDDDSGGSSSGSDVPLSVLQNRIISREGEKDTTGSDLFDTSEGGDSDNSD